MQDRLGQIELIQVDATNKIEMRDAIRQIYMQPHVLPYMSFDYLDEKEFNDLFEHFFAERDIYVLKAGGKVVATFSIEVDGYKAEFLSFGVDANHLGKGYGKKCYDELEKLLTTKEKYKDVIRVEQSQETGNDVAQGLAHSKGFKEEITFPDWLQLCKASKTKWLYGERFFSRFLGDQGNHIAAQSAASAKPFHPEVPSLTNGTQEFEIKNDGNRFICFLNGKPQAVVTQKTGVRRFNHLQFWSVELEQGYNKDTVKQFLRELAVQSAKQYKKVEIFSSDQHVIDLARELGFHCRGEKIASCKINEKYYNEVGVDLAFFDIADAKNLLEKIDDIDLYKKGQISAHLNTCQNTIRELLMTRQIDQYAALYLENLAFQMTREKVVEKFYDDKNAPWQSLVQQLPEVLRVAFTALAQVTNNIKPASDAIKQKKDEVGFKKK